MHIWLSTTGGLSSKYTTNLDCGPDALRRGLPVSSIGVALLTLPHIVDIILSRGPFSDCDSLLSDWRSAAGEQLRKEYLQAMSA